MIELVIVFFLGQTLLANPILPKDSYVALIREGDYYVIGKDSIYQSGDGILWSSRKHSFGIRPGELVALNKMDTTYLIGRGGGTVYHFSNDTIQRIDRSFEWRSRYYAHLFVRKDTIMSFAGAGLFAEKNNFIYYHPRSREWFEYYAINSDIVCPISVPAGFYEPNSDRYIFTLGRSQRYDGKVTYTYNRQVYSFDFSKRSWSIEGEIPEGLNLDDYRIVKNYPEPLVFNKNNLYRFDFLQGLLYEYRRGNILNILENTSDIVYNGQKKTFLVMASEGQNVRPIVIKESELLVSVHRTAQIVTKGNRTYWPFALLLALPALLWFSYQRRRKQKKDSQPIDMDQIKNKLDYEDMPIFQKIMEQHPTPVTYPELLQLYDDETGYETRVKKLRKALKNIDQQMKRQADTTDSYILISRNKKDKRIKEVSINMDHKLFDSL